MERPIFPDVEFDSRWKWPAWKYKLAPEDLFGELWDKYNTIPQPILSFAAWHYDVQEAAHQGGGSVEEFHRILGQKRAQRLKELYAVKMEIMPTIATKMSLLPNDEVWVAAMAYSRNHSLDTILNILSASINATPSRPTSLTQSQFKRTGSIKPKQLRETSSKPRKIGTGATKPKGTRQKTKSKNDDRSRDRAGSGRYNLRDIGKSG